MFGDGDGRRGEVIGLLLKKKQLESDRKVVLVMEMVEEEFDSAYEATREYLDS